MTKIFLVLSFFLFYINNIYSQKENAFWLFPPRVSVDFSQGFPFVQEDSNKLESYHENYNIISDANGNLLYYNEGGRVYNRNHEIMSNSMEIPITQNIKMSQQCISIKIDEAKNRYALISLNGGDSSNGELFISTIGMDLNNGLGSVVAGSTFMLGDNFTEQMFAIPHPCYGYWVVVHERNVNKFYSYHILGTEVISNVQSIAGNAYENYNFDYNVHGSIHISSNYNLYYIDGKGIFDKFKFNPISGVISNPISIYQSTDEVFLSTAAFSPDEQLFYIYSNDKSGTWIGQYDISLNDAMAIKSSLVKIVLVENGGVGDLQIGYDKKIYFVIPSEKYSLGVINNPNTKGLGCNFDPKGLPIPYRFASRGLPTPLIFETPKIKDFLLNDTILCASTFQISVQSNINYDSIKWSTGEIKSNITVDHSGWYFAELYRNECSYIDSVEIILLNYEEATTSIAICEGDQLDYQGQIYTVGDELQDTIQGLLGTCDTLLLIQIVGLDLPEIQQIVYICEGDQLEYKGQMYSVGEEIQDTTQG